MSSIHAAAASLTPAQAKVVGLLQPRKVLTLQQLRTQAHVSHVTVFGALRKCGYHRSVNQNGRYYTLKDTPRFDERGLWRSGPARFSIHGSLTATLEAWVGDSPTGVTAEGLAEALGARVHSSLRQLTERGAVTRERVGRQFVYFSAQPQTARRQRERHRATSSRGEREGALAGLPHKDTIIEVLLQLIERPRSTVRNAWRRMVRGGYKVSLTEVRAVFAHYELDKKRAP